MSQLDENPISSGSTLKIVYILAGITIALAIPLVFVYESIKEMDRRAKIQQEENLKREKAEAEKRRAEAGRKAAQERDELERAKQEAERKAAKERAERESRDQEILTARAHNVPLQIELLQNKNPAVRAGAALALEKLGPDAVKAVPDLAGALRDVNDEVRLAALKALQKIGPSSRDALKEVLQALAELKKG